MDIFEKEKHVIGGTYLFPFLRRRLVAYTVPSWLIVLLGAATTTGAVASTPGGSPPNDTAPPIGGREPGVHWPCTELMNSVLVAKSHSLGNTGHPRRRLLQNSATSQRRTHERTAAAMHAHSAATVERNPTTGGARGRYGDPAPVANG